MLEKKKAVRHCLNNFYVWYLLFLFPGKEGGRAVPEWEMQLPSRMKDRHTIKDKRKEKEEKIREMSGPPTRSRKKKWPGPVFLLSSDFCGYSRLF
jgi:hypothetical protein